MDQRKKGEKKPPKKKMLGMFNPETIHTGSKATDPGVLMAQANKAKQDSVLSVYKKKAQANRAAGVQMAQANNAISFSSKIIEKFNPKKQAIKSVVKNAIGL